MGGKRVGAFRRSSPGVGSRVEPTLDREWLLRLYSEDPVAHSYPRWDIDYAPTQCRFVTLFRNGERVSYLLVWQGNREYPIVHWLGDPTPDTVLAEAFPPRPFVAVVPEPIVPLVTPLRGPVVVTPLLIMTRDRHVSPDRRRREHRTRRLGAHDLAELADVARGHDDAIATSYRAVDPEATPVWGAFLAGRLVGVARAQVTLPEVWVITGVFTTPGARNRGVGGDVTSAVSRAAEETGAVASLVVREDNAPARRAYERIGFRPVGRRFHLSALDPPAR